MEGGGGVEEGGGWSCWRRAAGVCVCAAWGVAVVAGGLPAARPINNTQWRGMHAIVTPRREGGTDTEREARQTRESPSKEPINRQGTPRASGDKPRGGGEEEGKGCVCGSEQVSL
mgnify:CR=1 FL=1